MWPRSEPSCGDMSLPPSHSIPYIDSSFSPISRAQERYSLSSTRSPPKSSPWKRRTEMPEACARRRNARGGWAVALLVADYMGLGRETHLHCAGGLVRIERVALTRILPLHLGGEA